ncbi:hypothetical protein QBC35DRAFT_450908 [Podospora australis]|uniref:Uncharacterized protein n=1 Tax=Podospora australis TaxID=1536484 RepID=A0AAN7AHE1_9PEZI|nr:hypothetical protein QBC35DRAFT_450908 [Podospora australis]
MPRRPPTSVERLDACPQETEDWVSGVAQEDNRPSRVIRVRDSPLQPSGLQATVVRNDDDDAVFTWTPSNSPPYPNDADSEQECRPCPLPFPISPPGVSEVIRAVTLPFRGGSSSPSPSSPPTEEKPERLRNAKEKEKGGARQKKVVEKGEQAQNEQTSTGTVNMTSGEMMSQLFPGFSHSCSGAVSDFTGGSQSTVSSGDSIRHMGLASRSPRYQHHTRHEPQRLRALRGALMPLQTGTARSTTSSGDSMNCVAGSPRMGYQQPGLSPLLRRLPTIRRPTLRRMTFDEANFLVVDELAAEQAALRYSLDPLERWSRKRSDSMLYLEPPSMSDHQPPQSDPQDGMDVTNHDSVDNPASDSKYQHF